MNWDFLWGLIIVGAVGLFVMGLITAAHDDQDYVELNYYEENEKKTR